MRRIVVRVALGLVVLVVIVVGWNGYRLWRAWSSVERFAFDVEASRDLLPELPEELVDFGEELASPSPENGTSPENDPPPGEDDPPEAAPLSTADEDIDVYLLVGSDADKPDAVLDRADAIMVFVKPDDHGPLLTSLPRDLYLPNRCSGELERISVLLEGCGAEVTGPELLALTVEDFTGLHVDHFAVLSFTVFTESIDRVGGVEICLDNAMRLHREGEDPLIVPLGCSQFTGEEALAWIRDRTPEEFVDGGWTAAEGGDEARSQRQQQLLIKLLERLKRFRSPLDVSALVEDLSDAFALDDSLSIAGAIDIAWDMRRVSAADIRRPALPTSSSVNESGEFVRLPSQAFGDFLREIYAS